MKKLNAVAEAIRKNNMRAIVVENESQALDAVRSILTKGATISSGGSQTLKETGIFDLLTNGDYNYLDRTTDLEATHKAFSADYYLLGCNAITSDGVLYNVDGFANRISALTFGPKSVIVVAGKNKIVDTLDDAIYRVKAVAAPLNAKRLNCDTYCAKNGKCVSLNKSHPVMTDGCSSPARICCSYAVTAQQRQKDRITVILINRELGL